MIQERRLEIISDREQDLQSALPLLDTFLPCNPNTPGAVIGRGQEIMAVVPDVDHLVVKVKMSPMDMTIEFLWGKKPRFAFPFSKTLTPSPAPW